MGRVDIYGMRVYSGKERKRDKVGMGERMDMGGMRVYEGKGSVERMSGGGMYR